MLSLEVQDQPKVVEERAALRVWKSANLKNSIRMDTGSIDVSQWLERQVKLVDQRSVHKVWTWEMSGTEGQDRTLQRAMEEGLG